MCDTFLIIILSKEIDLYTLTKVCAPGINLNIGKKQIQTMFIIETLNDFVSYTKAYSLLFSTRYI